MKAFVIALPLLVVVAIARPAHAATGYVTGRLQAVEGNGNYCPTNIRDCTGARYPDTAYLAVAPLRNMRFKMFDINGGATLAQGTTDSNGNFVTAWSSPKTGLISARISFSGQQKDGVFELRGAPGTGGNSIYVFTDTTVHVLNGTSARFPQQIFPKTWGTTTSPHALLNLYIGAERGWTFGMKDSALMVARFANVQIRGIYDGGEFSGTGAVGPGNYVKIATRESLSLAVIHEMAHVADYKASNSALNISYDYCFGSNQLCTYPSGDCCVTTPPNPWQTHTGLVGEWQSVQFSEGFADAVYAIAMYDRTNPDPYVCNIAMNYCPANQGASQMEPSDTSCTGDVPRFERQVSRFLWDIYDSHADGLDNVVRSHFIIYDVLNKYAIGNGNRQVNEHMNSNFSAWDIRDGRNAADFIFNFNAYIGPVNSITPAYSNNCPFDGSP